MLIEDELGTAFAGKMIAFLGGEQRPFLKVYNRPRTVIDIYFAMTNLVC